MELTPPEPVDGHLPARSEAAVGASTLLTRAFRAMLGRVGVLVPSFVFAVVLARTLPPAQRGDFAVLQALNGFTAVAANFAVSGAVVFHVGKRLISVRSAASVAATLAVASSLLGSAVILPIALAVRPHAYPNIRILWLVLAVLASVGVLMKEYLGGVVFALGRPLRYIAAGALQPVIGAILVLVLLATGHHSLGLVVAAWVTSILISGVGAVVFTMDLTGPWKRIRRDNVERLGRFGIKTYPALLARFLNLRLDQFLVRALASASVLGQYAVAVSVGELLIRIPTLTVWAITGTISSREQQDSAELVAQFCRWTFILIGSAVAVIAVAAPIGIPFVFGAAYRPAATSVMWLLPGMLFYGPSAIIVEYFIVQRGKPARAALIAGTSLVTSSVLNVPLTPAFGADGASIASSISYMVMFLTAAWLFRADSGRSPAELLPRSVADLKMVGRAARRLVPAGARADRPAGTA